MSLWEVAETSTLFPVSGIKERMKDKKNSALKTAKLNASLASKIRTKTINNSSIIKVTLKQNNKALALALNASKIAAQRLTDEKMLLQKEVELCHFENACLRQKLSSVTKYIEELQNYMNTRLQDAMKLLSRPENGSCSLLLNDAEHPGTDNIAGNQDDDCCSSLAPPKPMRIPLSHVDDEDSENGRDIGMGKSTGLQTLPLGTPVPGSGESQKKVPTPTMEKSSSSHLGLAANENDGRKLSQVDGTASALNLSAIFGDNLSSSAQSSRSCSLSKNSPLQQSKITRPCSDSVVSSYAHVTKRKKHTTGVSTVFGSDSQVERLDNVLHDGFRGAKEPEATAEEHLEVSHVGELVSLKTKNKSFGKIKAKETKALNKVSSKAKNRDSSPSKSKDTSDNYSNDTAVVSESNKLSSSSKMKRPEPGGSSRSDWPEETVPLASFSQEEECSSKYLDKTTGCRTSSAVALPSSKRVQTFLEKMKNLESHFQNTETVSSNKTQRDEKSNGCEVSYPSQCSNKTSGCRRTYMVVPADLDHENDCAPSAHKIKKTTHLENEEDLGSLFPSPESSSLNSKALLNGFDMQCSAGFQKEITSQEEVTLGLNVKRLKPKRKTQEIGRAHMVSETEVQSLDVDMQFHTQSEESKTKKGHRRKAAKGNTQEGCCKTKADELSLAEQSPRVRKRTIKDLRPCSTSLSQADTPTRLSLGSTGSALPVSLDDEDVPLDSVFRRSTKIIQKVQGSAITQSSSFVTKTNSSSLEKTRFGANSHLIDVKKKVESMLKLSKRTTYTVSDLTELCVASDLSPLSPEACKNSQEDQARWNFLQVPSSRKQQNSVAVKVTPPHLDSLTKGPNIPDSSSKGTSKIVFLDSSSSGSSHSMLPVTKHQVSPERYSALPKVSAVFNKNYAKKMPSGRHEKKTNQATPEAPIQNAALQENENQVLKDLTNVSPGSCTSVPSEASPALSRRRRKKEISYAEPKLNSKLRRGDPFTVTDFLSSPIYKAKSKKSAKTSGRSRKAKKIEVEETELSLDFKANQ